MKKFKKFREDDDGEGVYEERRDRRHRLSEKRMRSALKRFDVDELMHIEED